LDSRSLKRLKIPSLAKLPVKTQQHNWNINKNYFDDICNTHLYKYYYRYIEKQPGKFVGDTACEKLPVKGCRFTTKNKETKLSLDVVFALKKRPVIDCDPRSNMEETHTFAFAFTTFYPLSFHTTFRTSLLVFLLSVGQVQPAHAS
jgi:hypothetical protein